MLVDITGQRFGRLTVLRRDFMSGAREVMWECACDCGGTRVTRGASLRRGLTRSCGCLAAEASAARMTTHGQSYSRTYQAWQNMISRCYYPTTRHFERYGGRGITVCARWRDSFEAFLEDMGDVPDGAELDRKANDGDYEPSNCHWATRSEQMRNTARTILFTIAGETLCLKDWAARLGIRAQALRCRLNRGWPEELALTTPKLATRAESPRRR
jgi:hypothetical protein